MIAASFPIRRLAVTGLPRRRPATVTPAAGPPGRIGQPFAASRAGRDESGPVADGDRDHGHAPFCRAAMDASLV